VRASNVHYWWAEFDWNSYSNISPFSGISLNTIPRQVFQYYSGWNTVFRGRRYFRVIRYSIEYGLEYRVPAKSQL
jgi:hypothetical protein